MLASLSEDDLNARLDLLDELPVLTPRSHRTMHALRDDLEATRARGYAVDDEQDTEGVTCFGVAVPGSSHPATAVSTTLLTARTTPELRDALVYDLRELAKQLTALVQR